jgi:hypothetical protein
MALMIKEITGDLKSHLARIQPLMCKMVPFLAVLCIISWCFVSLHSDFSRDDADSEILNQAWRLANGKSIYHDINTPPFAFAAYPPLYFALVAALLKFTGLSFYPAKLLTFLSALSIGVAFVYLSRIWKSTIRNGLWTAFFIFLIPAFLYNAVRSHAQMMAVAFSIWSLVFFLRNKPAATTVVSPLLAVLALYTKQTQIALPLAMILFLIFRNRRWLVPYLTTLVAAGIIPFLWLQSATGGSFFRNTVQQANLDYNALQIPFILLHHAGPVLICIVLALNISWNKLKLHQWQAMDFYLVCILGTTLISLGRIGAHGQYVIELIVVTLLYLIYRTDFPFLKRRKPLIALQILFLFLYVPLFIFVEEGVGNIASYRAAKKIFPILKEEPGPILSQQGSLALFARGEIYVQLFHFTGLSRVGQWDQQHLLNLIEKRIFPFVVTEFAIDTDDLSADDLERFTPKMLDALRANYQLQKTIAPYYLYRPRQPVR